LRFGYKLLTIPFVPHSGTRFTLSRDELLTLPEFVLLSLFPNGLFPEGHMGGFAEGDAVQVDVRSAGAISSIENSPYTLPLSITERSLLAIQFAPQRPDTAITRNLLRNQDIYIADLLSAPQYDPASLQYMLDFFRTVAQSIPPEASSQNTSGQEDGVGPIEPLAAAGAAGQRDDANKRAGIIVLREDLDFYAIPPRPEITAAEMIEVKRAAAQALLHQDGIFSGLKRSDEPGTTEAHLIEMLTAG
jgi:hypothetical protein